MTPPPANWPEELGAEAVDDPGGGQGAAVAAGLERADNGAVIVVNADVPCVVPHDLRTLAGPAELDAVGLVEAEDGTTNALVLPRASLFASLYGEGSAERFRRHFDAQGVMAIAAVIPNLSDDVDTMDDLQRIGLRAGPRTQAAIGLVAGRMKVALLSGGVGGARFACGLVNAVDPGDVTVIGNVGDDLDVLGLAVSPDLDSILYALAGPARRGARLGPGGRDLGSARAPSPRSEVRTGSGSATGISGSTSSAARRCARESRSRRSRSDSRGRSASRPRSSRRRTTGCAPGSTRRPAAFRFRSGSSPAGTATRSTAFASTATRSPRRVCSRRWPQRTRS